MTEQVKAFDICRQASYFVYEKTIYEQIFRCPMGSPLSPRRGGMEKRTQMCQVKPKDVPTDTGVVSIDTAVVSPSGISLFLFFAGKRKHLNNGNVLQDTGYAV